MASTSQPKKGILKTSGIAEEGKKEIEWDEMNIIATYHPQDKDYGHMKVDEPPTPFNKTQYSDTSITGQDDRGSSSSNTNFDPQLLSERLQNEVGTSVDKKYYKDDEDDDDDEDEDANLSDEERRKRKEFKLKRKMHYNEFAAVQLAKKLIEQEESEMLASLSGSPLSSSPHMKATSSLDRRHSKKDTGSKKSSSK